MSRVFLSLDVSDSSIKVGGKAYTLPAVAGAIVGGSQLTALDTRVGTAEATLATAVSTNSTQASAISALQSADTALGTRIDSADSAIVAAVAVNSTQASAITALQSADTALGTRIDSADSAIAAAVAVNST